MTNRRVTKALRELGLDRRGRAAAGQVRVQTKRSLGLEGPDTDRSRRRRKGFRTPVRAKIGGGTGNTPRHVIPHPWRMVDPATNLPLHPRPVSHTNFIRRAAKRNAPPRVTIAQLAASLRATDPTVTKSQVRAAKRRRWRLVQSAPRGEDGRLVGVE